MKKKGFTEGQIVGILHEAAAGATIPELCRKHEATSLPLAPSTAAAGE